MATLPVPLEIFIIPYIVPSHATPMFDMARLFAARGEHVTVVATPCVASMLQKSLDNKQTVSGHPITFQIIPFPLKEAGLPENLDETIHAPDLETARKMHHAFSLLQHPMEEFMDAHRPDCIISDAFYCWTSDVASRLSVPRIVCYTYGAFSLCIREAMRSPHSPYFKVESDDEEFLVPGFPDEISLTRSQLPDYVNKTSGYGRLMEQWREAEVKSYGVLINTFYELDSAYIDYYRKAMGHKVFPIGPSALFRRKANDEAERGFKAVVGEHECLSWLGSKKPNSVLYISFGSWIKFKDEQLLEIAFALEASGHQFIWVILGKENEKEEDEDNWLPKGFSEKIKGRGMVIKGWAPQLLILDHPSIGGFMTHCGWNSVMEGVCAGVPFITWPLSASDQFLNQKFVTEVVKIGVSVGVNEWNWWFDVGKKVIKRENIEKAVTKLMGGGGVEAAEMRKKAKELGEKAERAVEESGSSHRNLTVLIEELKQLKDLQADNP